MNDTSNLKRPQQPMPADIVALVKQRGVAPDYEARPAYQRNDYLGWIGRARNADTRQKRIDQMLAELEKGGVYMNMVHNASRKP